MSQKVRKWNWLTSREDGYWSLGDRKAHKRGCTYGIQTNILVYRFKTWNTGWERQKYKMQIKYRFQKFEKWIGYKSHTTIYIKCIQDFQEKWDKVPFKMLQDFWRIGPRSPFLLNLGKVPKFKYPPLSSLFICYCID